MRYHVQFFTVLRVYIQHDFFELGVRLQVEKLRDRIYIVFKLGIAVGSGADQAVDAMYSLLRPQAIYFLFDLLA